jgi:4-hydroxybenzoate polyprenyltransferase
MDFFYKLDQISVLFRVKQWIKNLFIFAPLIFSGQLLKSHAFIATAYAALIFCLASASVYILNDIKDVESDRKHPQKSRLRPIASNLISIKFALTLLFSLYLSIILGLFFLAPKITWAIFSYIFLNLAYTYWLKNQPVFDIFSIALCFVLRVYAGALALNLQLSSWMFITY